MFHAKVESMYTPNSLKCDTRSISPDDDVSQSVLCRTHDPKTISLVYFLIDLHIIFMSPVNHITKTVLHRGPVSTFQDLSRVVLSTYLCVIQPGARSSIMTRKDIGPSLEPCDIAPFKINHCDTAPCTRTLC